jgi:hypothetical protein
MHIYSFLLFRTCLFHCYALTTKSMNVTGYTSSSSNVCVCLCSHKWAKIVFFFSFLSFFVYTSPNNRRRLLLERRATLLKYLVLQYINRVSKKERGEKRENKKELDDILTTNNYCEHEYATADLLCIAMIIVLCERRIYSNFTAELYTHTKWCSTTYLRNKKCRVV